MSKLVQFDINLNLVNTPLVCYKVKELHLFLSEELDEEAFKISNISVSFRGIVRLSQDITDYSNYLGSCIWDITESFVPFYITATEIEDPAYGHIFTEQDYQTWQQEKINSISETNQN